jgi:hypothetical protein
MKTHVIERRARTGASPAEAFAVLADSVAWPEWSPIDSATVDRPGVPIPDGVGQIRTLRTGRITSVEEIVAFEPDEHYAYVLHSGLPIRNYRADVRLSAGAGGTDISWRSTFEAKVPFTGWIFRMALGKFIGQVIDGFVARLAAGPDPTSPVSST